MTGGDQPLSPAPEHKDHLPDLLIRCVTRTSEKVTIPLDLFRLQIEVPQNLLNTTQMTTPSDCMRTEPIRSSCARGYHRRFSQSTGWDVGPRVTIVANKPSVSVAGPTELPTTFHSWSAPTAGQWDHWDGEDYKQSAPLLFCSAKSALKVTIPQPPQRPSLDRGIPP